MASAEEHYEKLLAEHYTWMRGDYDSKVREYRDFFEGAGILPRSGGRALDLGAGSGFQTAALAGLGFEVVSVDTSETLLRELVERAAGNGRIQPVPGDMRDPEVYSAGAPFEVAVCMGDTLTHLSSRGEVLDLAGNVYGALEWGGRFVLEFRDLTTELKGSDRAIPVRMDEDRIMATFLEYGAERVNVHDLIFVRDASGWTMHKSAYAKLRLGAGRVLDILKQAGFRIVGHGESGGFSTAIGRKS